MSKIVSFLGLLLLTACGQNKSPVIADLVITNANVITIDKNLPEAQAFAIKNNTFIYVGTTDLAKKLVGDKTLVLDMQGKTITPGFIDAHMHPRPIYPTEHRLGSVDLRPQNVKSMEELVEKLKEKAAITEKGQWVRGFRYEDTKLGRHPTREDLDKVSTDHPVVIRHSSGHVTVVNSYALKMANITKITPDPPGGSFGKSTDGTPNGICYEGAGKLIGKAGPELPEATLEEKVEGLERCFANFLEKGITGVVDASASPEKFRLYQAVRSNGSLLRVGVLIHNDYLNDLTNAHLQTGFGDEYLRIAGVKIFHGNSLSGRTCWLSSPYDKINPETGKKDYYGIPPGRSQRTLDSLINAIHSAGLLPAVHSNGDREIDMVLSAFEKALNSKPKEDHRFRIEHGSVATQPLLDRMKDIGVTLVPHSYVYEHGDKMVEYGKDRWDWMHVNKTAYEMGIPVAGNSDYGVSAADPLLRIQSMVTRKSAEGKVYGENQKVSPMTALKIWTMGSAYATFEEDIKGSISEGKLADFVVLSDDPLKVHMDSIKNIEVLQTYIAGQLVFDRNL